MTDDHPALPSPVTRHSLSRLAGFLRNVIEKTGPNVPRGFNAAKPGDPRAEDHQAEVILATMFLRHELYPGGLPNIPGVVFDESTLSGWPLELTHAVRHLHRTLVPIILRWKLHACDGPITYGAPNSDGTSKIILPPDVEMRPSYPGGIEPPFPMLVSAEEHEDLRDVLATILRTIARTPTAESSLPISQPVNLVLGDPGSRPLIWGREVAPVTTPQHTVLQTMVMSPTKNWTMTELAKASGYSDARRILGNLCKERHEWLAVIHLAGGPHGGFFLHQSPPPPAKKPRATKRQNKRHKTP